MYTMSQKILLRLDAPQEDAPVSDQKRIQQALLAMGYPNVTVPLPVLRKLYPLCRTERTPFTATLVQRETDYVLVDIEAGDTRQHHYGLAVDYGSTTIVMRLVDMNSGAITAQAQALNGQAAFGSDILTRITYCMEAPDNARTMRLATADTFHRLMAQLSLDSGIDASRCAMMVISGNTTMIHFLLELDAWSVFASPYAPVTTDPGFFFGKELDMDFSGLVYIIPAASNYVGGDIVSGLLALELHKRDQPGMLFDIGTNGELVIGSRDWMLAGAGAAGPALEGYISRYGMRAAPGAIDRVAIRGSRLSYTTIDGQKPVGICGSGIIDLLAQMRLNGWIDIAGQLNPQASDRIVFLKEEMQYAAVYALSSESATGEPLYFSQTDISQYLDTKAAAFTMIECLLESAGISAEELETFHLSGAFPAHADLESAITIGIFPDLPRERYRCTPNTSLEGAQKLLLDRTKVTEAKTLAETMYCVQFASIPDFLNRMQAARFIPHTDMDRFPSIGSRLKKENRL